MPFNSQQFLTALSAHNKLTAPSAATNSFNDYIAKNYAGLTLPKADITNLGLQKQAEEDTRGVFSKTMGWLASLGSGVENVVSEGIDAAQGDQSWGDALKNSARDLGATAAAVLQPVIDLGPIDTPWDDAVSDFTFKYNTQYKGERPASGAGILEDLGVKNKWAKYGLGFGVDVLTDPLTYFGVGAVEKVLKVPSVAKSILSADEAVRTGSELAKAKTSGSVLEGAVNDTIPTPNVLPDKPVTSLDVAKTAKPVSYEPPKNFKGEATKRANRVLAEVGEQAPKSFSMTEQAEQLLKHVTPDHPAAVAASRRVEEELLKKGHSFEEGRLSEFLTSEHGKALLAGKIPEDLPVAKELPVRREFETLQGERAIAADEIVLQELKTKEMLTPKRQANLYNRIYNRTAKLPEINKEFRGFKEKPNVRKWRHEQSLHILRHVEDVLASQGRRFRGLAGGSGVRLSDVIAEIGPKAVTHDYITRVLHAMNTGDVSKIADQEVRDLIETAIARRTAQVAPVAEKVFTDFSKEATVARQLMSPHTYERWLKEQPPVAKEKVLPLGMTEEEANMVANPIKQYMDVQDVWNMEPYQVVEMAGPTFAKAVLNGTVSAKDLTKVSRSITKQMGYKSNEISRDLLQNGVAQWFGHNMTTWYGRGALIKDKRILENNAANMAKARSENFNQVVRGHSPAEIDRAYLYASKFGKELTDIGVFSDREIALGKEFSKYFEEIFGAGPASLRTKFGKNLTEPLQESVLVSSQMTMNDINHYLSTVGTPFRFTHSNKRPWWESWRDINPNTFKSNPVVHMYNLDLAVQRTLAEYNLIDMFREFGKAPSEAGFDRLTHTHEFSHPRINSAETGIRFDPQVLKEFHTLLEDIRKGAWQPGSKGTQFMTSALRRWKSSVTIYYPAHHERNLIGDSWLMWVAGYNDPRVFYKAQRVIGSQRSRFKDIIKDGDMSDVSRLLDPESKGWVQTEGRNVIIGKHNANITADEIYGEMSNRGILMDVSRYEDLQGETIATLGKNKNPLLEKVQKPFGGKVHRAASQVSEMREHYVRIAHMVGYIEKHMSKELGAKLAKTESPLERSDLLKDFLDKGAAEIRKYHPDGSDMTYFEQKYLRNIVPFYSWMRKAIPLTMEAMVLHPAKVTAYPRAMYAIQGAMGIGAPGGMTDPFPTDQLFPDWVHNAGIGPIGDPESENPWTRWWGKLGQNEITQFGVERGYTIFDPGRNAIPTSMISQFLGGGKPGDIKKGLTDVLTPFFTVPSNLASGTTNTGRPLENASDYLAYTLSTVPQTAPFQRVAGVGKSGQENLEPGFNMEALLNMLFPLGIQGTGKYIKTAQFQEKERLANQ